MGSTAGKGPGEIVAWRPSWRVVSCDGSMNLASGRESADRTPALGGGGKDGSCRGPTVAARRSSPWPPTASPAGPAAGRIRSESRRRLHAGEDRCRVGRGRCRRPGELATFVVLWQGCERPTQELVHV